MRWSINGCVVVQAPFGVLFNYGDGLYSAAISFGRRSEQAATQSVDEISKVTGSLDSIVRLALAALLHRQRHSARVGKCAEIEELTKLSPGEAFVVNPYSHGG